MSMNKEKLNLNDIGEIYNNISLMRQSKDIDWILDLIPNNYEINNCLDICCGSGLFIKHLMSMRDIKGEIVGIDKSPSMIQAAKANNLARKRNVRFICSDICNPQLTDLSFSLVVMMSALHWLYPNEKRVF